MCVSVALPIVLAGSISLNKDSRTHVYPCMCLTACALLHLYNHTHYMYVQIDANCDNSIDWDEFSSYMLLENEVATVLRENELLTMYEEPSTRDESTEPNSHRDVVSRMLHVSQGDRVITAGRDGSIKVWSGKDQSHIKTIKVSNSWVTDVCYMPRLSKLASCSFNRSIKLYDLVSSEVVASSSDLQNAPISICSWTTSNDSVLSMGAMSSAPVVGQSSLLHGLGREASFEARNVGGAGSGANGIISDDSDTFIATGDTGGCINFYTVCERNDSDGAPLNVDSVVTGAYVGRPVPAPRGAEALDKFVLKEHRTDCVHSDWINKVMYINDLSAVASCSLDKTLCINDVERNYSRKLSAHTKCVYSFDWSPSYKFLASCGMDRLVILWNPITRRPLHTLTGHTSAVQDVLILEEKHQILSLSVDKQIKVWDIRNHRCIQTVTDRTAFRPENKIGALAKDNLRATILTATLRPKSWVQRKKELRGSGHSNSVVSAMYNPPFRQVVSGDADGAVCVWDVLTGRLLFRYADAHAGTKMTAMTFDSSMRRLITGAHDGSIKMWNFSNGSIIKTLVDDGGTGAMMSNTTTTGKDFGAMRATKRGNAGAGTGISASRLKGGGLPSASSSSSGNTNTSASTSARGGGKNTNVSSTSGGAGGGNSDEITELLFTQSATGTRHLIGVGWSRQVIFWEDVDTKECLPTRRLHGHNEDILCVAQSPPSVLATGAYDGVIIIWNIESGAVKFRLIPDEYKPRVTLVDGGGGSGIGGGGGDTQTTPRDTADGGMRALSDLKAIEVVRFLHTKQHALLATGADGILRLWNSVDGRMLWSEHAGHRHSESIISLGLESSDEYLVTGDTSGVCIVNRLILTSNERSVTRLQKVRFQAHDGDITSIFLVEEKCMVITGGLDAKVKLWDYEGVCVGEFGLTTWNLDDRSTWFEQECSSMVDDDSDDTSSSSSPKPARTSGSGEAGHDSGRLAGAGASGTGMDDDEEAVDGVNMGIVNGIGVSLPTSQQQQQQQPLHASKGMGGPQRSAAMQAYQQHREERHERRVTSDFSKRIYLPSSSGGLNFPTTPGRASTSVAHVLHIADLTDVSRPHTVHSTSRTSRSSVGGATVGFSHRRLSTSTGGPRALHRGSSVVSRPQTQGGMRPMTVPASLDDGLSGSRQRLTQSGIRKPGLGYL